MKIMRNRVYYAGLLLACFAAFWFARNHVLYLFYVEGVEYLDGGFFAGLFYQNNWLLINPDSLGRNALYTDSFYGIHVSPFLVIFTYLSHLLPLNSSEFTAFFLGLGVAVYAVGIYIAIVKFLTIQKPPLRTPILVVIAAVAAFFLASNGLVVSTLDEVHYELWMHALICLFVVAYVHGNNKPLLILLFVLLLSVREDTGLHFALLMLGLAMYRQLLTAWDINSQRKMLMSQKEIFYWVAAAIIYTAIAFSLGGREPLESGISSDLFFSRVMSVFFRTEWFPIFVVTALWALYTRNVGVLLGFAVCLPWAFYSIIRVVWIYGNMTQYQGHPLMLVFYFPFLAGCLVSSFPPEKKEASKVNTKTATLFVLLMAAAAVLPRPWHSEFVSYLGGDANGPRVGISNYFGNVSPFSADHYDKIEALKSFYLDNQEELDIVVDTVMTSLTPNETFHVRRLENREPVNMLRQADIGVLIFNIQSPDYLTLKHMHNLVAMSIFDLSYHYLVPETNFVVASKMPLCDDDGQCAGELPLQRLQMPTEFYVRGAAETMVYGYRIVAAALATEAAVKDGTELIAENAGVVAELPELILNANTHATFDVTYEHDIEQEKKPLLALYVRKEGEKYADPVIVELPPSNGEQGSAQVNFDMAGLTYIHARLLHQGGGTLRADEFSVHSAGTKWW